MSTSHRQYIVYACPVGELNHQIKKYLIKSRELYGDNSAHKYMPHCTLTGFFKADINVIPIYIKALEQAYIEAKKERFPLAPSIKQLKLNQNWHGLELESEHLQKLISSFASCQEFQAYPEKLRLKTWLHLSLAYDFAPENAVQLTQLAIKTIDLKAEANWQLCFYQKDSDWSWKCLKSWTLI